jgi:hypothetical protein
MIGVPTITSPNAASVYRAVYDEVERVRAGGTKFDMYLEDVGCY